MNFGVDRAALRVFICVRNGFPRNPSRNRPGLSQSSVYDHIHPIFRLLPVIGDCIAIGLRLRRGPDAKQQET